MKLGVAHPMVGRGGSECRAAWLLRALGGDHDAELISLRPPSFPAVDDWCGCELAGGDAPRVRSPAWGPKVADLPWGDRLRGAAFSRFAASAAPAFDAVVSAYNPLPGLDVPALHFLGDLAWDPRLRERFDPVPPGLRGRLHRLRPLYRTYGAAADLIAPGDPADAVRGEARVVANSRWTARVVEREHGRRLPVVYPPVPGGFAERDFGERREAVVALGRIAPEKRYGTLVDVVGEVRRRTGRPLTLDVYGPVPDTRYGRDLRRRAAGRDFVELKGELSADRKREVLPAYRYALHGRRFEPFGITVAEFAKAGCVTVVPDEGGPTEIVDHPALTYGSPEEAAAKLAAVVAGERDGRQLSRHVRTRGARFSVGRFLREARVEVQRLLRG